MPAKVLDRSVDEPWELNDGLAQALGAMYRQLDERYTSTRSLSPCSIWIKNSVFGGTDMSRWSSASSGSHAERVERTASNT